MKADFKSCAKGFRKSVRQWEKASLSDWNNRYKGKEIS